MAIDDGQVNVSDGARAAIGRAKETLRPHVAEPRVKALVSRLDAIGSPEGSDEDEVLKAMASSEKIAKSADVSPVIRARAAATSRELQRAWLQKHSVAAPVWEAAAKNAGLVD